VWDGNIAESEPFKVTSLAIQAVGDSAAKAFGRQPFFSSTVHLTPLKMRSGIAGARAPEDSMCSSLSASPVYVLIFFQRISPSGI
jgi:hypothetical protein